MNLSNGEIYMDRRVRFFLFLATLTFSPYLLLADSVDRFSPPLYPAGGVSGGGGFFYKPYSPKEFEHEIDGEALFLNAFDSLKKIAANFSEKNKSELPEDVKAFLSNKDLFAHLKSIEPVVHSVGACFDENYQEVDGSLYSFVPHTICLSSFNLIRKVDEEDMTPQVYGILFHEYSELIGYTEKQAVKLQESIIRHLRKTEKD
jgi:hypothetical protein